MLHLALEIFLLVLFVTVLGFAAGFTGGKLFSSFGAHRTAGTVDNDEYEEFEENSHKLETTIAKRIPDPAPPSQSRRKRLVDSVHQRQ